MYPAFAITQSLCKNLIKNLKYYKRTIALSYSAYQLERFYNFMSVFKLGEGVPFWEAFMKENACNNKLWKCFTQYLIAIVGY